MLLCYDEAINEDKAKATEKVDLSVAFVMALDRVLRNETGQESVY